MNRYPIQIVLPMKEELTKRGFQELLTEVEVDLAIKASGTTLIVINSVCGCSAGALRPGVLHAIEQSAKRPDHLYTSFAGYDLEAVAQIRTYLKPYPPSSPSIALFKDGKLLTFIERHQIEGNSALGIAEALIELFATHC